jgi:hypothetical protein
VGKQDRLLPGQPPLTYRSFSPLATPLRSVASALVKLLTVRFCVDLPAFPGESSTLPTSEGQRFTSTAGQFGYKWEGPELLQGAGGSAQPSLCQPHALIVKYLLMLSICAECVLFCTPVFVVLGKNFAVVFVLD